MKKQILYDFGDAGKYSRQEINDMNTQDFKMFISFLDIKDLDKIYNFVDEEKRTILNHIYRSLK